MLQGRRGSATLLRRLVEYLDADIAVPDEEFCQVQACGEIAAMHLKGDPPLVPQALFLVRPVHELYAVDPGVDRRWVADDPGAEDMPLPVLPEIGP
jgi:hypothetical protein